MLQYKIRNMNMILRRKGFQGYDIRQLLIYGIIYSTLKLETLEFVGSLPLIFKGLLFCFRFYELFFRCYCQEGEFDHDAWCGLYRYSKICLKIVLTKQ